MGLNDSLPSGATPLQDESGLKLSWIKTRDQLNRAEAENILKASSEAFSVRKFPAKWFRDDTLKTIHFKMFKEVWSWAGLYYLGPLRNIGIKSTHIPIQVRELCNDVQFWLEQTTDLTFLEQSAHIHFRLAKIHSFPNGNGRHARLIADLYLHSLLGQRPAWPEGILVTESNARKEYIQSLRNADRGDFTNLVRLLANYGGQNPAIAVVLQNPLFKHFSDHKQFETIQNLLRFGSKVNETSSDGYHPLQLAVRKNLSGIAKLLIQHGANPHQKDKSGLSPCDWALKVKNQELLSLLRSKNAISLQ